MKLFLRKLIACLVVVCFFASTFTVFSFDSSAAATLTKTLDLTHIKKNEAGSGYVWDNMNDKLTLNNFSLITTDDYGLRLPEGLMYGCTVELVGDNYISAAVCALTLSGTVTFTGTGTLTLVGGECGMWNYSQMIKHSVKFMSGTYDFTGGVDAVRFNNASFVFVDGNMKLTSKQTDGMGFVGRTIKLVGGNFNSNASLYASYLLEIDNADVKIDSTKMAASVGDLGSLIIDNVKIITGYSEKQSQPVDSYNGDVYLVTTAKGYLWRDSIIFGEAVPGYVDYIVLAAAIAAIALVVALPLIHQNKKRKLALARSEEYIADREAEFKAVKKQRRNSK